MTGSTPEPTPEEQALLDELAAETEHGYHPNDPDLYAHEWENQR